MAFCIRRLPLKHIISRTSHLLETTYPATCYNRSTNWFSSNELGSRCFHASSILEATSTLNMPSLSPTMTEGTIVKWLKKEGEAISPGDVLCEIQTDKAVVSLDYDDEGVLAKIIMPEDTKDVKVGTLIALIVEEGDDWQNVEIPKGSEAPSSSIDTASEPVVTKPTSQGPSSSSDKNKSKLLGPAVRNYLAKYGLKSSQVSGNGPHGIITKSDVLNFASSNNLQPAAVHAKPTGNDSTRIPESSASAPASPYVDIEISSMRKTIAKRLLESKTTIPHSFGTVDCGVEQLLQLRKMLLENGVKVSVNDLIIKCTANALSRCPLMNVVWDAQTHAVEQKSSIDISIAVATPNGLITPIISNAYNKSVSEISVQMKDLAGRAKEGKLQPHEFMGGSFSISNLGMFGIHSFSAIINPPQCGIMAVGGTTTSFDKSGDFCSVMNFTLSYNANAIPEEEAMRFLAIFKTEIENASPVTLNMMSSLQ